MLTEDHSYSEAEQEELLEIVGRIEVVDAPGVGHDLRAHPPDVHAHGRAARPGARPRSLPGPDRRHPARGHERRVVAYIPVLHEGYRRFLHAHARDRPLYLIGPELLRGLPAAGQGHPRARRADEVAAGDRGVGHARGPRARSRRAPPALAARRPAAHAAGRGRQLPGRRALLPARRGPLRHRVPALGQAARASTLAPAAAAIAWSTRRRPAGARRGARPSAASTGGARSARRSASPTAPSSRRATSTTRTRSRLRRRRPAQQLLQGRAPGAVDGDARRGAPDRRGRPRRALDRRRRALRHRLPVPAVREADRRRRHRARCYYRTGYAVLDGQDVLGAAGVEIVKIVVSV